MKSKYSVLLILILLIISCTKLEKTIPNDIINNQEKYNQIIKTIEESDFSRFSLNQFISKEYFPSELKDLLKTTKLENKVEYLIFHKKNCEQKSFELASDGYYIVYNPCPEKDFPLPNSYLNEGITEIWGINKNWMMWKDNGRM